MGMGKTVSTLTAVQSLKTLDDLDGPVLVLAPLRVAKTTWPEEIKKWDHLSDLTIQVLHGPDKKKALHTPADIYVVNYEGIEWLVDDGYWPFKMIVADESTKLKAFRLRKGSKRAKALASKAWQTDRWVNLTGTPAPNGLLDLWGQNWFVDRGAALGRSFSAFTQRWFRTGWNGWGYTPLEHAQKEIQNLLSSITLTVDPKEYFDLRDPILNRISVDLPPSAMSKYKTFEREMFASLASGDVTAVSAAALSMKCLQFANGGVYLDETDKEWEEVHTAKLEALDDIIEEAAGAPILIAYHFRSDLERLKKRYKSGVVLDNDPKTIKAWNRGGIPLLFAHPASAGHGLNLQDGGHTLVFFSLNWNLEEHQQIIERIGPVRQLQSGHDRAVFIHYLVAKGTVDELVLERLQGKREVQDILLEAMKKSQKST